MQELCPACNAPLKAGQRLTAVVTGQAGAEGRDLGASRTHLRVHAACWTAAELSSYLWTRITEYNQGARACRDCRRVHWPCPVCAEVPRACGERDGPCPACLESLDHRGEAVGGTA